LETNGTAFYSLSIPIPGISKNPLFYKPHPGMSKEYKTVVYSEDMTDERMEIAIPVHNIPGCRYWILDQLHAINVSINLTEVAF
jgi:hypothetical protein